MPVAVWMQFGRREMIHDFRFSPFLILFMNPFPDGLLWAVDKFPVFADRYFLYSSSLDTAPSNLCLALQSGQFLLSDWADIRGIWW